MQSPCSALSAQFRCGAGGFDCGHNGSEGVGGEAAGCRIVPGLQVLQHGSLPTAVRFCDVEVHPPNLRQAVKGCLRLVDAPF